MRGIVSTGNFHHDRGGGARFFRFCPVLRLVAVRTSAGAAAAVVTTWRGNRSRSCDRSWSIRNSCNGRRASPWEAPGKAWPEFPPEMSGVQEKRPMVNQRRQPEHEMNHGKNAEEGQQAWPSRSIRSDSQSPITPAKLATCEAGRHGRPTTATGVQATALPNARGS